MVKNAGSKNKRGRLMKNMKSPNSGLTCNGILCDSFMQMYYIQSTSTYIVTALKLLIYSFKSCMTYSFGIDDTHIWTMQFVNPIVMEQFIVQ